MLGIRRAAPDSSRSCDGGVRAEPLVANLRMWANFSSLVRKVKTTGWNVHKLRNMLLQLLACVVRGCAIDQCLSGQSAQQEL